MDHIVSHKKGSSVKEMFYFQSTAKKVSDLRRWRGLRKNNGEVIIFFEDGTVHDTFLANFKGNIIKTSGRNPYWRHYYRINSQPRIGKEKLLAHYRCKFYIWKKIVIETNGINELKKTKTLCF